MEGLDAKAEELAICMNLDTWCLRIQDNGHGITKEDMKFIGLSGCIKISLTL
jgi:DNA mismatch repair ATPase MutL